MAGVASTMNALNARTAYVISGKWESVFASADQSARRDNFIYTWADPGSGGSGSHRPESLVRLLAPDACALQTFLSTLR
ncbi:hypothetical protein WA026_017436 [Henosepilachna vigintioctopunctata]|uniref:Uncharacterized protein n=1 Tax=Henosepilachna vigintioctopunctata TaxID=420089 RepID=A0AAW1V9U6_9CUCU